MRFWPPFWGAGIRVTEASRDFTHMAVVLKFKKTTRNAFGTQFGGSIFMMTDPFYAIMLSNQLGRNYRIWDTRAEIDFIRPGRSELYADFRVSPRLVEEMRQRAKDGRKVLHWFECEVLDSEGQLVARVRKELYIRERLKVPQAVRKRSRKISRARARHSKTLAKRAMKDTKQDS